MQLAAVHYNMAKKDLVKVQIIVVGESGVGKSTMLQVLAAEQMEPVSTTVGVELQQHEFSFNSKNAVLLGTSLTSLGHGGPGAAQDSDAHVLR
jgi:GTP-binding protein EngB required for normal cell division